MSYTLGEAAKATGKSKMTIQRAIKSGRMSASRRDDDTYDIDPSELHRVFPSVTTAEPDTGNKGRDDISDDMAVLRLELKVRDEKIAALQAEREREREQLTDQIDDLRRRLDTEGEERRKLTALLTDQRPLPKRRRWWQFGKPPQ
jgi:excisionase family DNA binding protein